MNNRVLQLDPRDNVLIALSNLSKGESGDVWRPVVRAGFRRAREAQVRDAGFPDGRGHCYVRRAGGKSSRADTARRAADHAQCSSRSGAVSRQIARIRWKAPDVSKWQGKTFRGYRRSDGQVGTRNYWVVVPLVFCENRNIGVLKQAFEEELGFAPPQIYRRQVARAGAALQGRPH